MISNQLYHVFFDGLVTFVSFNCCVGLDCLSLCTAFQAVSGKKTIMQNNEMKCPLLLEIVKFKYENLQCSSNLLKQIFSLPQC